MRLPVFLALPFKFLQKFFARISFKVKIHKYFIRSRTRIYHKRWVCTEWYPLNLCLRKQRINKYFELQGAKGMKDLIWKAESHDRYGSQLFVGQNDMLHLFIPRIMRFLCFRESVQERKSDLLLPNGKKCRSISWMGGYWSWNCGKPYPAIQRILFLLILPGKVLFFNLKNVEKVNNCEITLCNGF